LGSDFLIRSDKNVASILASYLSVEKRTARRLAKPGLIGK
jgi:hypothetical protein